MKEQKKSWLYHGTAIATILTLIGIWSHLATAFSTYEVRDANSQSFEWSLPGMIIASSISLFLILTAIGITWLEKRAENMSKNKKNLLIINGKIRTLNWFLGFFAFIEMYGNVYYSIASILNKPMFTWDEMLEIDTVAKVSIFMFSFTLTLISIVGSKLLSIFAVNEIEEAPAMIPNISDEQKVKLRKDINEVAEIQKQPTYEPVPEQVQAQKPEAVKIAPPELTTKNRA